MKKLIILVSGIISLSACSDKPKNTDLVGKLERQELAVVGKVAGRIMDVKVEEGTYVKKGDTLAILDIPELKAKRNQAEGALTSASAQYHMTQNGATQNQLQQLEAKKQALTEQYRFAEKSANRLKGMVEDSLIPLQQYDEVYAKLQGAKAQLIAVEAEIADVKNGLRIEQQQMALGQQDRASGALQEVEIAESERYIIAPQDMKISSITLKVGELALPGYTLFKGELPLSTTFRFTIPESQVAHYQPNQEVKVKIAYNGAEIDGYIRNIKQTGSYANIANPYPDYKIQDVLYDIVVAPKDAAQTKDLLAKATVILQ